jgi:hypothetical protein
VERIRSITDPQLRNLEITQCYHELSAALAGSLGPQANWCSFAVWASKQAGQTIRKEDLARLFERAWSVSPGAVQASAQVSAVMNLQAGRQSFIPGDIVMRRVDVRPAVERASDAVARGNRKVFEEIGREFARFQAQCLAAVPPDPDSVNFFCAGLRPGEPPEGQERLRRAFQYYAQAVVEPDLKMRAELIFLANLEIGFHEQTRLQPEIAESLDSGLISFLDFVRPLFREFFPLNGWLHLGLLYLMRLLGRPTDLDRAVQDLLAEVRLQLRRAITEVMMTITLPSGVVLRLGKDLEVEFSPALKDITHPELKAFLERHDQAGGGLKETGALDWADLNDRLTFIIALFRAFQQHAGMFEAPFDPAQVGALKSGKLPEGRL